MTSAIVTYAHRYKRPPRKKAQAAPISGPAVVTTTRRTAAAPVPPINNRTPAIVSIPSRKHAKLASALKAADTPDDDPEATARVKAFFARMMRRPGESA